VKIKTAHALALASKAVYSDESDAESWAYESGYSDFEWFEVEDTQAMVVTSDDKCVLAFRGTTDIADWMTNLDVWKTAYRYGNVHSGFHAALDFVWDEIELLVAQHSDKELHITGHSLGGALATLAMAELQYTQASLYTFGSPRVGDKEFATTFNQLYRTYRFVNNNDVVTRIPLAGYDHIGSLRHFTTAGKMLIEPSDWRVEMDRIWGRMRWAPMDGIKDHDIGGYGDLVAAQ
jgi:pimeloyl-ACP methyl ester carboxylesterase